ncbi:MAG: pectate lyase [Opitutus sp.]|nr:pectate lyase [Opitutus sp.]
MKSLAARLLVAVTLRLVLPAAAAPAAPELAFPGAMGWAATTPGGRGGQILRVTTLAADGPGSFLAVLNTPGPRIIVFEVGGVIDLRTVTGPRHNSVSIKEPFLTIAGQTAPSPGITFIRGGISIETHDVVIRHIRVRPGAAGYAKKSGWEPDSMATTGAAWNVIVDHSSFTWSIDENLSTSGKAFTGTTAEEWRKNTSHRVTFSNNIIAEGLSHATHASGEHSKGTLLMDNVTDVLIVGNLYANCSQRHPLAKGGTWVAVVNNFMFNPGVQAVAYRLPDVLWHDRKFEIGKMDLVGNVMRAGADTREGLALLLLEGIGDLALHLADNVVLDRDGGPSPLTAIAKGATGEIREQAKNVHWPPYLDPIPASAVEESVLKNAGARPWDRDAIDQRIVRQSRNRTGRIIDNEEQVGGYPVMPETRGTFNAADWDLRTMERKTTVR